MSQTLKKKYSDAEIIQAIEEGGKARYQITRYLYMTFAGLVRKAQQQYGLTEEAAKDAYSDALLGLIQQIERGRFRGESSLFTYLYRIFRNKCADRLKAQTTNETKDWTSVFPQLADESKDLLRGLIRQEEFEQLMGLLQRIGEQCRKIIMDAEYWGYKPAEIAERHGFKNAQTAKSQKYKCMQKLKALIAKQSPSGGVEGGK